MTVLPILLTSILFLGPVTVPRDTLIDVGGALLRFEVHGGTMPLTLVLEAGGGADASSWGPLSDSLARRTGTTVVAYDRAGLGGSTLGPPDLTPEREVRNLRDALGQLGVPSRTVIVGTSYGGMLAILHAGLYPDHVAGLVLVDPMNPIFVRGTEDFVQSTVPDIAEPRSDREHVIVRMKRTLDDLTDQTAEIEPALRIPMILLTAGEPWWGDEAIDRAWRRSHESMAGRSPERVLTIADGSDHDIPGQRPDLILNAVSRIAAELETIDSVDVGDTGSHR